MGWFRRKTGGLSARDSGYEPAPRATLAEDPVEAALQAQRFGLLARPPAECRNLPSFAKLRATMRQQLEAEFLLVPAGVTSLALHVNPEPGTPERDVETAAFLLARCAVTHAQFQFFVDSGAYEQADLWPEEVWPQLVKFCDLTGAPGPRYWREGRHDKRLARHPVVGISWYEAAVYAAWAGLRLPTDAEWQVATAWQVGAAATTPRRYPWGDVLDLECCNLWASGHNHTLPVDACPAGAAPNGVLQLVGNTWEWLDRDLDCKDEDGGEVIGEAPLKVIRGGAFDTYFPWQATSSFRSGLPMLARAHNVGFRCALDAGAAE